MCCFSVLLHRRSGGTGFQSMITVMPQDTVMTVLQRVFDMINKDQCALVGLLCWGLWYRRNQWVWEHVNQSVFGMKSMAFNMLTDWKKAKAEAVTCRAQMQVGDRMWSKPPTGWVKVNVDAACKQNRNFVGVGCVIRDATGKFLRARSNVIEGSMQPRMPEALSLREALQWTRAWKSTRCIFESDCKLLVDAVNGRMGRSFFDTIVADCREEIKHFEELLVVFVHRSANTVAHMLAGATYSMSGLQEWYHTAPDFIACNLISEEF